MTEEQIKLFIEFQTKLYETFTEEQKTQFQEHFKNNPPILSHGDIWTWFTT